MRNLTLSLFSVVLIATIGLGWLFDNLYNQYGSPIQSNQKDNITLLEQVGKNIAYSLNKANAPEEFINNWPQNNIYQIKLTPLAKFPLPTKLIDELKTGQALLLETEDSIDIHFYLSRSDQLLSLSAPPSNNDETNHITGFVLTSLFYVAVLALMLLWLTPLVKRLLALRQTAKNFGEGDLEQRVQVGSIAYISDLETEFNHMAQRIEGLVSDVKLLSSAVSHDLRTPLARIRFGIDTLQEEDDPVLRKRFEQRISENVDEMVELVETLLNYARLDQTMINIEKTTVDFSMLVKDAIKNKTTDNIHIDFICPEKKINVYGDPSYLMILVANLVQNASQYCQDKITIELKEAKQSVVLIVSDNGEGIAQEQRQQILKPFIRGTETKDKVKGYGMGLAIVKRILQWHQGEISIANSEKLKGAEFTIELPTVTNDKAV
mgnify:CR=1 FL=1